MPDALVVENAGLASFVPGENPGELEKKSVEPVDVVVSVDVAEEKTDGSMVEKKARRKHGSGSLWESGTDK